MRLNLVPRERKFFELFRRQVATITEGANALRDMLTDLSDPKAQAKRLRELENEGDAILHEVMNTLAATFITPLDREDIHALASTLDDILDYTEEVADTLVLYEIKEVRPELQSMSEVLAKAVGELQILIENFEGMKNLSKHWIEVNTLENEGDRINRKAISNLFKEASDPIEIIKWKDLYRLTEQAIDRCEDVANIVENIVIRHA